MQETKNRFEILCHISTVLNSSLDMDQVLDNVMDQLITLTGAERGFICFVDEKSDALTFPVARNMSRETLEKPEREVSRTLIRKVFHSGQGELLLSAQEDPRFIATETVQEKGLNSVVCVPMKYRDRPLGVVYVENRLSAGVFRREDLVTLSAFANIAATALENARLYGELHKLKSYQDAVFESVESGIVAADPQGNATVFNRAAERIFSLARNDVLHRPLREALHGRAADLFANTLEQVTGSGEPVLHKTHSGTFAGSGIVDLRYSATPLNNADGKQIGATMIVDDISERVRLVAERDEQEAEKKRFKETLRKMVSVEVADLVENNPSLLSLEGTSRNVTILFSDLVGFTARSEHLPPQKVIAMLNSYFAEMCQCIARNQGTVKQFVGDEIMVLFNAARDASDHALLGVWTAIDMVDRLRELAKEEGEGFYDVKIGVHTGNVVLGGVGAEDRMEFAAVGDNVNLCNRVMELNPRLGTRILISEDTYYEVCKKTPKDILFTPRGVHMVRGRDNAITVYEVSRKSWEL